MAEASGGDEATLREHNCAIRAVIERFPEICIAEERFLKEVLGAEVTRQRHIASGSNCCEYCIAAPQPSSAGETEGLIGIRTKSPLPAAIED